MHLFSEVLRWFVFVLLSLKNIWDFGWNLFVWPMADGGIVLETFLKTVVIFAFLFGDTSSAEISAKKKIALRLCSRIFAAIVCE